MNRLQAAVDVILKGVGSDSYNPSPRLGGGSSTAPPPGGGSASPTDTLGEGGQSQAYGGYITNHEGSAEVSGKQRFVTYSDMMANTAIVATGTRYFLNILSKATWKVQPAQDADGNPLPGAEEVADFVESTMGDMLTPWFRVVRRSAMYRFFGFSVQEWTAKRRADGRIGMLNVAPRPQVTIERWDMDRTGLVNGCWQRTRVGGGDIYLPRSKIIHVVDDALEDSPEGLGLFRHVVKTADRIRAYEELEAVAFETDLRGIPIARAPLQRLRDAERKGDLDKLQIAKLLKPLDDFVRNHIRSRKSGLLVDSVTYMTQNEAVSPSSVKEWDLELLQGNSTSQEAVAAAINRLNLEAARVLGVEHLMLGSDGSGSLALGKVKVSDFYMVVSGSLSELTETYGDDYVDPLLALNGIPEELKPKLSTDNVQFRDVEEMANNLAKMAAAGAVLAVDDPAINEMRDLMGLSRPSAEMVERELEDAALGLEAQRAAVDAAKNPPAPGAAPGPGGAPPKPGARPNA